ncbi:MAG: hypothetical protein Q8K78_00850, partial [Planctomycetaceae bacterium]|nr:hypothetical protein [Planctomycetaceae bacterium]
ILAVPMLAIFGIPQFTPAVASPYEEGAKTRRQVESEAPPFSPKESENDPFNKVASNLTSEVAEWGDDSADRAARTLADRRNITPATQRRFRDQSPREATEPSPFASVPEGNAASSIVDAMPGSYRRTRTVADTADTAPKRLPVRSVSVVADPQLTWRDAVQKLNALEIRNFRLEPGQQPMQFLFSCSYTPRDNPRVSHWFEAEADEPLRAVERVLEQIDTWRAAH